MIGARKYQRQGDRGPPSDARGHAVVLHPGEVVPPVTEAARWHWRGRSKGAEMVMAPGLWRPFERDDTGISMSATRGISADVPIAAGNCHGIPSSERYSRDMLLFHAQQPGFCRGTAFRDALLRAQLFSCSRCMCSGRPPTSRSVLVVFTASHEIRRLERRSFLMVAVFRRIRRLQSGSSVL